jgi:LmbE family N-acetylglucosaminyl deacetylase
MNILAIGAHFDDVELGCGGTLARHVLDKDNVYVYVATLSGFSNHNHEMIRKNSVAKSEGSKAMKILGVKKLIFGNFKTLKIKFDDELNIEILSIIEKYKIDTLYTHWTGDVHHDHQAVAKSSLHSGRHLKNLLMYRSNWYHSSVVFNGNYYVDVSTTWKKKELAILEHKSEMLRTNKKWIDFFYNEAKNAGQRIGVKLAEVFEIIKLLK